MCIVVAFIFPELTIQRPFSVKGSIITFDIAEIMSVSLWLNPRSKQRPRDDAESHPLSGLPGDRCRLAFQRNSRRHFVNSTLAFSVGSHSAGASAGKSISRYSAPPALQSSTSDNTSPSTLQVGPKPLPPICFEAFCRGGECSP